MGGVNFTIAKLGQHESIESVYGEWNRGRGGLPGLKSVLEHYGAFYPTARDTETAWKKAISQRKTICKAIEERGVQAMQSLFEAQGAKRWEGLIKAVRSAS